MDIVQYVSVCVCVCVCGVLAATSSISLQENAHKQLLLLQLNISYVCVRGKLTQPHEYEQEQGQSECVCVPVCGRTGATNCCMSPAEISRIIAAYFSAACLCVCVGHLSACFTTLFLGLLRVRHSVSPSVRQSVSQLVRQLLSIAAVAVAVARGLRAQLGNNFPIRKLLSLSVLFVAAVEWNKLSACGKYFSAQHVDWRC